MVECPTRNAAAPASPVPRGGASAVGRVDIVNERFDVSLPLARGGRTRLPRQLVIRTVGDEGLPPLRVSPEMEPVAELGMVEKMIKFTVAI